jgi:hypothetical protein
MLSRSISLIGSPGWPWHWLAACHIASACHAKPRNTTRRDADPALSAATFRPRSGDVALVAAKDHRVAFPGSMKMSMLCVVKKPLPSRGRNFQKFYAKPKPCKASTA